ncbi:MAG: nucleotidyltransferase domain-containing protein [Thermodesulfobacteriota bacterium]|nr:nucleotidyltransferase domain-containing protein [Thermodesulfobacteriota bacterium]
MNQENVVIMKELKERLQRKFSFISKVILFGSQATGKAVEFSDYDILIIVNLPISWQQRRKILDEVYVSDLKYNILTDVKIISEPELKSLKGKQPFVQYALQEGVVV